MKSLYKQSFLGYAWLFFNPLAQLITFSFVFSTILKTPSQGVPFALFLFIGLLPWIFFSSAILASTDAISGASNLVTSVYFPRELLVMAAILARIVELVAGAAVLILLMLYHGQELNWTVVWIPIVFLVQMVFTVGLALPLAALNLFFHDVRFLVGVGLNLWFFVTPVMYPPDIVPDSYRFLYDLNPLARFVTSYRGYLLMDRTPSPENIIWATAISILTLAAGFYIFKKLEPMFADRI